MSEEQQPVAAEVTVNSDYDKGFRDGMDEAMQIAVSQAKLMADIAIDGLPESSRRREAMEAALNRYSQTLLVTLEDLVMTRAALSAIEPALASHDACSDRDDAERFRALMRCGRIKMQGSSGVDPKTGERDGNNVHFGAEFWPEPIPVGFEEYYEQSTKWGRFCIKALADAILEEEARAALATTKGQDK